MAKKPKQRFIVGDGVFRGGVRHKAIFDTTYTPPKQVPGKPMGNDWIADRTCERLNLFDDKDRARTARELQVRLGGKKKKFMFTFGIGWNRTYGTKQSILCLLPDGPAVYNCSHLVATVCGFKWKDDNSVDAGRSGDLIRHLSFMLYGKEDAIENKAL